MTRLSLLLLTLNLYAGVAFAAPTTVAWRPAEDCRANIRAVLCRVNAQTEAQRKDPRITRECLGGEESFLPELLQVHDELPPKIQKMFCYLRCIYLEDNYAGTAYATAFQEIFQDGNGKEHVRTNGNVLALSIAKLLAGKVELRDWLNHKEQTMFGLKMTDPLSPLVPTLDADFAGVKAKPVLLYVILHEFAHLLDFSNNVNSMYCDASEPDCKSELSGLWPSISWLPNETIRPEDRYFGDFRPCYYDCDAGKLASLAQAKEIYRAFVNKKSFVSLYASVTAWEDFAESFVFYVGNKYFSPAGEENKFFYAAVTFPGDEVINLNSRTGEGRIRAKMQFMEMFDVLPWQYQADPSVSIPLEQYLRTRKLNPSSAHPVRTNG